MTLEIRTLVVGPFQTNSYLLRSGEAWWVVDPGLFPEALLRALAEAHAAPERILLTHGHVDHVGGAAEAKKACPGAILCCPAGDAHMLADPQANLSAPFGLPMTAPPADELLTVGQRLDLGDTTWTVLDTSGHTPGGVSFYCPAERVVLCGDALFFDGIGRTDLPGASDEGLRKNIRDNLLTLPEATVVLPGHGAATTIGRERRANPYVGDLFRPGR